MKNCVKNKKAGAISFIVSILCIVLGLLILVYLYSSLLVSIPNPVNGLSSMKPDYTTLVLYIILVIVVVLVLYLYISGRKAKIYFRKRK